MLLARIKASITAYRRAKTIATSNIATVNPVNSPPTIVTSTPPIKSAAKVLQAESLGIFNFTLTQAKPSNTAATMAIAIGPIAAAIKINGNAANTARIPIRAAKPAAESHPPFVPPDIL